MKKYIYQNWFRGKRKMQSEENTLWYYSHQYKAKDECFGPIAVQKKAKAFLKTCTSTEEWAKYAYEHGLEFYACKMDANLVEAYLHQDLRNDIVIGFLDEYNRIFMFYVFKLQKNGKYFLSIMSFWEFEEGKSGDDDDLKKWDYLFYPNGNIEVHEHETGASEECIWTSKEPMNVESNWEPRPEFGNWEGFFKMERWKDGELDEAFKGQNITTPAYNSKGQAIPKTNYPYTFLSFEEKKKVEEALKQALQLSEKKEGTAAIELLQNTFNSLPDPKENYEASSELLIKIIEYNSLFKNYEEAFRLLEKLPKYLNPDNYHMLPLYKGAVHFYAGKRDQARVFFNEFIAIKGQEQFNKYPEYKKMYLTI